MLDSTATSETIVTQALNGNFIRRAIVHGASEGGLQGSLRLTSHVFLGRQLAKAADVIAPS